MTAVLHSCVTAARGQDVGYSSVRQCRCKLPGALTADFKAQTQELLLNSGAEETADWTNLSRGTPDAVLA